MFLTRGDLWLSWVAGKDVFEELLLDYESAVCCGLWMKSSCSAFLQGPIQHYCPVTFGKKIDPEGQYIRTFCPELRRMPSEWRMTVFPGAVSVPWGSENIKCGSRGSSTRFPLLSLQVSTSTPRGWLLSASSKIPSA